MVRHVLFVAAVLAALLVGWATYLGVADVPWSRLQMGAPDTVIDKYLTLAAWDGYGTDKTALELVNRYGIGNVGIYSTPTRTPGTFVVFIPLLATPDAAIQPLMALVSVSSLVLVCVAAAHLIHQPPWVGALLAAGLAWTPPMLLAYLFANSGVLVTALVVAGWVWKDRPALAGGLLAVAATLKVWPALIGLALLGRHGRTVAYASVLGIGLNATGLLLPGVTLQTGEWQSWVNDPWNWSLFDLWPFVVSLATALWFLWRDEDCRIALAILVGLAVVPLSWAWYWAAAIPALAVIVHRALNGSSWGARRLLGLV